MLFAGNHVNYVAGQQVLLSTKNLRLPSDATSGSSKFRPRYVGPYEIDRMINPNAARLITNEKDTFHPVINVSSLKPFHANPPEFATRPGGSLRPAGIADDNGQVEFEVELILGHRYNRRKRRHEYCVKWAGYPDSESTWEPVEYLYNNSFFLNFINNDPITHAEVWKLIEKCAKEDEQHSEHVGR